MLGPECRRYDDVAPENHTNAEEDSAVVIGRGFDADDRMIGFELVGDCSLGRGTCWIEDERTSVRPFVNG